MTFAILLVLAAASLLDVVLVAFMLIGGDLGFYVAMFLMSLTTGLCLLVSHRPSLLD